MTAYRDFLVGILVILPMLLPTGIGAQGNKTQSAVQASKPPPPSETELSKFQAEVIKTMTAYRKSLEKLLAIYERDFRREVGEVQDRRELYEKGYISRLELEESQRRLASTEGKLKETEAKIAEAKIAITEASVREELLKYPRLGRGEYVETAALIRYNGVARWSIAEKARIEKFFADRFGRLLPISALGQTAVHDRMKFDHRNAIDVALHPDSLEGRELMAYLRKKGIPFMAFRNSMAGSASGAHIHIGRPSLRAPAQ
ncbi:MAG: hypothetical protein ACREQA_02205 [Candidatus Binatia bacterium]